MSPKEGQKNVTIPEWAWDMASEYFERHREILASRRPPIKSVTGLITSWIQQEGLTSIPELPGLEHFNTYEDHATIRDHRLGLYIDLYPKPEGELWCAYCESTSCDHVEFALTVPDIIKPLEKRGWRPKKE